MSAQRLIYQGGEIVDVRTMCGRCERGNGTVRGRVSEPQTVNGLVRVWLDYAPCPHRTRQARPLITEVTPVSAVDLLGELGKTEG